MYKFLFLFLCFFCVEFVATAQNQRILDSLNHIYQIAEQDTSKIIALNLIASQYVTTKVDTAISITQQALKLSETIKFKKGIGNSLYNLASCNFAKGNYELALALNKKKCKNSRGKK
jgi:tetratricopeptide (TPR) repeat protein